ncbi:MAG: VOC family protein [Actinomycetota bacterium]|nr:VOC family protein [Actinomycetota bacterium]
MPAIPNAQLTHMGLFVNDPAVMVAFYTELFGFEVSDAGEFHGKHLTFLTRNTDEHHQLVLIRGRTAGPGEKLLGQVSFRVDTLADLRHFLRRSAELGATEHEARNHGNSWSIYFRDPDHNFIEMYVVTPWQVRQPWRVELDLDLPDAEIEALTKQLIDEAGVFVPLADWTREMAARIAARSAGAAGTAGPAGPAGTAGPAGGDRS